MRPKNGSVSFPGLTMLSNDSHCPWIAGCVGWRNHKFFYLFIFYASIFCLYVCASSVYALVQAVDDDPIMVVFL